MASAGKYATGSKAREKLQLVLKPRKKLAANDKRVKTHVWLLFMLFLIG